MSRNLWTGLALVGLALGSTLGVNRQASAKITGFAVTSSSEIGSFRGISYREVQGMMAGTAPGGAYSVPVVLAFPVSAADYNGFAFLDVVNTVTVDDPDWVIGGRVYPVGRFQLGENYLFGSGNLYVSALWDKRAAEILNTGMIASAGDGYEILRDVARLARNPALAQLPSEQAPPRGADKVIAFGYSQSGRVLHGWYHLHLNASEGAPTFDGAIIATASGCLDIATSKSPPCKGPPSDRSKIIVINAEGDAERSGFEVRGETEDYRLIEIAGVPHLPSTHGRFSTGWLIETEPGRCLSCNARCAEQPAALAAGHRAAAQHLPDLEGWAGRDATGHTLQGSGSRCGWECAGRCQAAAHAQ